MFRVRLLPWEYAVRNLFRRPVRSALTLAGLTTVVALVLAVTSFVRGLERSLTASGDDDVALVFSLGMGENLEYSSIPTSTPELVSASLSGVRERYGRRYVSPELYLGTQVRLEADGPPAKGLLRGVSTAALLVRRQVQLTAGAWPGPDEVLVGRLAASKLDAPPERLAVGQTLLIEGRPWRISGQFAAAGAVFEAELWCRLDDLQQALKRQDLSLVALALREPADYDDLALFTKQRLDLELQSLREPDYYATLQRDYGPVRWLAWLLVAMIAAAGVFAGLNTMYGAVLGRIRELATLQTLGFQRRAIVLSVLQEGLLLGAAASLLAAGLALAALEGAAFRFTMGAFLLRVDGLTLLIGCGTGLLVGLLGSLPAALRALASPIVEALKAV